MEEKGNILLYQTEGGESMIEVRLANDIKGFALNDDLSIVVPLARQFCWSPLFKSPRGF